MINLGGPSKSEDARRAPCAILDTVSTQMMSFKFKETFTDETNHAFGTMST